MLNLVYLSLPIIGKDNQKKGAEFTKQQEMVMAWIRENNTFRRAISN